VFVPAPKGANCSAPNLPAGPIQRKFGFAVAHTFLKTAGMNRRAIYFGLFLDQPTPAGGAARKVEVLTRHSRWNLARAPSILRCPQCWASGVSETRCR
jgi:hypothetical protein